jgi:hypothetical protein
MASDVHLGSEKSFCPKYHSVFLECIMLNPIHYIQRELQLHHEFLTSCPSTAVTTPTETPSIDAAGGDLDDVSARHATKHSVRLKPFPGQTPLAEPAAVNGFGVRRDVKLVSRAMNDIHIMVPFTNDNSVVANQRSPHRIWCICSGRPSGPQRETH